MNTDQSLSPYALAVDDDPLILMDALAIMEQAGFRTLDAREADEAVRLLDQHGRSIALLFTDVEMPSEMDGFGLARHTAMHWPDIAIVVASGERRPSPTDMPKGARFIAKPFSAAMVHGHLQELLPDGKKPEPLRHMR